GLCPGHARQPRGGHDGTLCGRVSQAEKCGPGARSPGDAGRPGAFRIHGEGEVGMSRSGNGSDAACFAPIEVAIAGISLGRLWIVVDDEGRENEGDLSLAADKVTPEAINFMARYGRGLICMPMTEERLEELDVPLMVKDNPSPYNTAFCVSIEARR